MAAQTAMRRRPPTTAREPGYGILISLLFHGLIVAAALITFHNNFAAPEESNIVPVDLVTIANKTNVTAQSPPAPPQPEKIDIPPPQLTPPPEPDMQDVEPAPVPPLPEFKIAKEKPVEEKPPVDTKKQQQQDFADLLNKLTAQEKPVKTAKTGPRAIQGIGAGNMMTADLVDALRSQIRRCWSLQIFPPNPADAIVDFAVTLTPSGNVGSAQLLTQGGNTYTQAAAAAASRAIYECQPYHLPPDRYNEWRDISRLHFDPREMMEQ